LSRQNRRSTIGLQIAHDSIMKTNNTKNEVKRTTKTTPASEAMVMHTEGGKLPFGKKSHNRELVNAEAVFSDKSLDKKKVKKH
jgi:hypothetical protein